MTLGAVRIREMDELASKLGPILDQRGCSFAYLAGSWSQGLEMPWSDIDVFVFRVKNRELSSKERFDWLVDIGLEMEMETRIPNLDVRDLDDLPPHVQFSVISSGTLIYRADETALCDFKVATMKLHYDLHPWRQRLIKENLGLNEDERRG